MTPLSANVPVNRTILFNGAISDVSTTVANYSDNSPPKNDFVFGHSRNASFVSLFEQMRQSAQVIPMEFSPGSSPVSSPYLSEANLSLMVGRESISTINPNSTPISFLSSPYYISSSPSNTLQQTETGFVDEEDKDDLVQQYLRNRALDTPSLVILGIVYTVLIFIGAVGNGLVCLAVARQPKMRTSRNLFIINLAISDLLLCFFTIPFSLVEISTKSWPYGIAMCKLVLALEATSIFVSTLSITAIALDRYQVILHSMNPDQSRRMQVPQPFKLLIIWACGILLALPLFLFRTIESHKIGIAEIDPINFCLEKWPIQHGRGYYSIFSMLIQYVVPITIVTVVYTRLCIKLRTRTLRRTSTTQLPKLRTRLQRRARKTNLLLISIALIFCISWLPLNVLNIVADIYFPFNSDRTFRITFAICHMAGMSSSCSNPFLYGWLNQNFRNEFEEIFLSLKRCFLRVCMHKQATVISLSHRRGHSLTVSPNHELMHYQTKNSECTVTDYRNVLKGNHRNNIMITVDETSDNRTMNHGNMVHIYEPTSGIINEPNTTQIYLSTTFGPEDSTSVVDSTDVVQSNGSRNRANSNSRFKRLSLTDSRKRKRKKDQAPLSISAISTDQSSNVVLMDNNNNGNKSKGNLKVRLDRHDQIHDPGQRLISH